MRPIARIADACLDCSVPCRPLFTPGIGVLSSLDGRSIGRNDELVPALFSTPVGREISTSIPPVSNHGFVVLDTETTGLHDPARVIEVALVFLDPTGAVEDSWTTLVRGDGHAGGRRLEQVHGIRDRDLVDAPDFAAVAPALEGALAGRTIFGHNSNFDRARLNFEFGLARRRLLPELGCTMYLGMHLGHGRLKLDDALERFDIDRETAHCAHDDALATAHLLRVFLESDPRGVRSYLRKKGFA